VDTVAARLIAERDGLDLGRDLAPLCLHPAPRFRLHAGEVLAVGPTLAATASRPAALSPQAKLLAATSGLRQIIAVDDGQLAIIADTTLRLPVPAADSATFLQSGQLLVTAPNIDHQTRHGRTFAQRTTHRVLLINPRSGAILDETILDGVFDAGVFAIANPADGSVLLDAAEGQDGSKVFAVRDARSQIRIEHLLENVVTSGFSPDGDRLLLLPHPSFDGPAIVASWPSMDPVGTASPQAAGINDDAFDLYGCFLDTGRVLLKTVEDRLLLARGDLAPLTHISLTALTPTKNYSIGLTLGLGPNLFAAELWTDGQKTTTVWELPSR
jgi:hypothetical protein